VIEVYLLKASAGGASLPVGCVLINGSRRHEFFLSQPEAGAWRDILQETEDPNRWCEAVRRLSGYEVEKVQDRGRRFGKSVEAWTTYVALNWDARGAIPRPTTKGR
jgi:hypothetical protein